MGWLDKFFKEIFETMHKDIEKIKEEDESKTRCGISGTSIYADHEYVKKLAQQDLKDLKAIFDPKTEEDITEHLIFLQNQSYKIRKEIELFQEKLNKIKNSP